MDMVGQRWNWQRWREWDLRWGKGSNSERLLAVWRRNRRLTTELGVVLRRTWREYRTWIIAGVVFAGVVALVGGWLLRHSEEIRNLMLSAGVIGAGIGVWIAFRRSETDRLRQVTESFAKAVELLGHEDRSVRLGAIYALERIARQNRDEHWPIMETLTAYVRDWSERKWLEVYETESAEVREGQPLSDLQAAPADIQCAGTPEGRS